MAQLFKDLLRYKFKLMACFPTMPADRPGFWRVLYIQSNLIGFEETSSYCPVQFVQFFPCVSFVILILLKTTESYEISLVTINRQTSYDSGILRQEYMYGTIRGMLMNHTGFAD